MNKYQDKDGNQYYVYEYNSILGVWRIEKIGTQEFLEVDKKLADNFIVEHQLTLADEGLTEVNK
ncbi:unnamed protein product [Fructobacillus cardui]|uniref:hypothetical protein n=1 Tax=Fructobacillus cardui TaxID=2893170 RepID=UPI002D9C15A0|nr:unnamed protein product [Fructobacillus cardui]